MSKIILEEQAAPSTPATDKVALYPKAGGQLHKMSDDGNEYQIIDTSDTASETAEGIIEIATLAETLAFSDTSRAVNPKGLGAALAGVLAYGVEYDDDESSPTLTRIGALAGFPAGSSPGDSYLPIQAKMRRCLMADDGTVNYYLDPNDSTKKEDGVTASVLTGADGQVMVEIPKFYHSYTYNATTHVHRRLISSVPLPGFTLHPAFWKNGAEVDYRYIGAYEGSMYDASLSQMVPAADITTDMYASGDKLCSLSGEYPKTNETRAEFRSMAAERGAGWRQLDFDLVFAIQLLYLVEYASFNSQSVIGMGRTELSGGTWTADSYIGQCGKSNGDGNGTNSVGGNTNNAYMTYRGIENFYGNVWKWVDGFNINGGIPYVSNDDTDFADDTATGTGGSYSRLKDINGDGITLPQGSNDYQKNLEQIKNGLLPSTLEGSSSTYITDYYYQAAGWRVAMLGGDAGGGSRAGVFHWHLYSGSATGSANIAGRLSR